VENEKLKENLTEREKELLKSILKENAYKQFLDNLPKFEENLEENNE